MNCTQCGQNLNPNAKFCDNCGNQVIRDKFKENEPIHTQPPVGHISKPPKKLYRSRGNRVIGGVCGGIGEYFNIDPTLVRLLLFFLFLSPIGLIIYLVAVLRVPISPYDPWVN